MAKAKDKDINRYIIKELGQKQFWPWMADAAFDWSVIVVTFYAAYLWNNPIGYVFALFVIGNRQHALAILGHDGTHYTIHKNKKLNDFVSDVLALIPIGLSTSGYRNLHHEHHRHLNTEHDPELKHRSSRAPQWDLPITPWKIFRYGIYDLVGYSIRDYWDIIRFSIPSKKFTYVQSFVMHASFIAVCIAFNALWVPVLWYWSLLTTFMMYFRLRTWLEHQGDEFTHRLELNWFERLVVAPHNVEHHYEHHAYPSISYRNLHKVREVLEGYEVMNLGDLVAKYKDHKPVPSGQPTKAA